MNQVRLQRSLTLLRTVNAWRLRAAKWPKHVAAELRFREEQLAQHDADCRTRARTEHLHLRHRCSM